jgi:hypothetical protein
MLKLWSEKRAGISAYSADFPALKALVYEPFGQAV